MDEPQDKENAMAGLLTGIMLTMLGGAFPALLIWDVISHWEAVTSGSRTMTYSQAVQGVGLLAVSLPIFRSGTKMVKVNATGLRRL